MYCRKCSIFELVINFSIFYFSYYLEKCSSRSEMSIIIQLHFFLRWRCCRAIVTIKTAGYKVSDTTSGKYIERFDRKSRLKQSDNRNFQEIAFALEQHLGASESKRSNVATCSVCGLSLTFRGSLTSCSQHTLEKAS